MSEARVMKKIWVECGKRGIRLFRNNVGQAWQGSGKIVRVSHEGEQWCEPGDVILRRARPINFGLEKDTGDLIGWTPVLVTPDMVGSTLAVFTSVETKDEGYSPTEGQLNWQRVVKEAGGRAFVAYSEADVP